MQPEMLVVLIAYHDDCVRHILLPVLQKTDAQEQDNRLRCLQRIEQLGHTPFTIRHMQSPLTQVLYGKTWRAKDAGAQETPNSRLRTPLTPVGQGHPHASG